MAIRYTWCFYTYLKYFKESIAFISVRHGIDFAFPKVDQIHPEIFHVALSVIYTYFSSFLRNSNFDRPTVG